LFGLPVAVRLNVILTSLFTSEYMLENKIGAAVFEIVAKRLLIYISQVS
jgi:hypothetical protein